MNIRIYLLIVNKMTSLLIFYLFILFPESRAAMLMDCELLLPNCDPYQIFTPRPKTLKIIVFFKLRFRYFISQQMRKICQKKNSANC